MKKIKITAPAKLNLTLDVTGVQSGYHTLESLVCSIDLADYITVKKRTDLAITLTTTGIDPECDTLSNNAYISAKKFCEKYSTDGVDITIEKNIPVGAGLGGSSADSSGVLNALKELFEINDDLTPLANTLGSDNAFMLNGGWAVLSGRGEQVEFLSVDKTFYLVIITEKQGVSSKMAYREFDQMGVEYKPCTKDAVKALLSGDYEQLFGLAKNDLYPVAKQFVDRIEFNIGALKKAGAPLAVMTGSGSAVVGVFTDKAQRDRVFKALKPLYKEEILVAQTLGAKSE